MRKYIGLGMLLIGAAAFAIAGQAAGVPEIAPATGAGALALLAGALLVIRTRHKK
jgi:hypothetical protein